VPSQKHRGVRLLIVSVGGVGSSSSWELFSGPLGPWCTFNSLDDADSLKHPWLSGCTSSEFDDTPYSYHIPSLATLLLTYFLTLDAAGLALKCADSPKQRNRACAIPSLGAFSPDNAGAGNEFVGGEDLGCLCAVVYRCFRAW